MNPELSSSLSRRNLRLLDASAPRAGRIPTLVPSRSRTPAPATVQPAESRSAPPPTRPPRLWQGWLRQRHIEGVFAVLAMGIAVLLLLSTR